MKQFVKTVLSYYRAHGRSMPWRERVTPYRVVVSEIMLQQTQVSRVMERFDPWMKRFPDWRSLARASTKDVLEAWSGLGYNRRALYLKRIAETVTDNGKTKGTLPKTFDGLRSLPGIGPNTAGSILAFAYNIPYPFIETNIRSVFIHFFFPAVEKKEGRKACKKIDDDEIMPFIETGLASATTKSGPFKSNSREWYYALMDYGAYLKKNMPNPSRRSVHHMKQAAFKGSNRELRGKILRALMKHATTSKAVAIELKAYPLRRIEENLASLEKEGFLIRTKNKYAIMSA